MELTLSQRLRTAALSIYSGIHPVLAHPAAPGMRLRVPGMAVEGKGSLEDPGTNGTGGGSRRKKASAARGSRESPAFPDRGRGQLCDDGVPQPSRPARPARRKDVRWSAGSGNSLKTEVHLTTPKATGKRFINGSQARDWGRWETTVLQRRLRS